MNTRNMVSALKDCDQDFEFYPTTDEMLETVKKDLVLEGFEGSPSILDCGAGDGRALNTLTKGSKYAIEKAEPLLASLDKGIFVVGTEFDEQTLVDKKVDVIFSNPPYSVYEAWATKIVKEANAGITYLIIPTRWADCEPLQAAIKEREAKTSIIGSFDFLKADRAARAKVDIVKIEMSYRGYSKTLKTDPFDIWFSDHFKLGVNKEESSNYEQQSRKGKKLRDKVNELVEGSDLVHSLYEFYQQDMLKLLTTYQSLENVDVDLLRELDVNIEGVRSALKLKISGLKNLYWANIQGKGVFAKLKFESGVHRVQRVPETESGGRIHTSAATVAVLPEPEEVDIKIRTEDLRIDTYRASGAGGQHVNKTDSAIRITHLPTGLVVQCQDGKSQHKNKAQAMKVLAARLYEQERDAVQSEEAEARKSMVGSGDRSERIRTYNYPQGRVTDHRINLTLHKLPEIIEGTALGEMIDALIAEDEASRLANLDG